MKLETPERMITPRVPVIAKLRPVPVSPEIWPLKAVALMVIGIIVLCAVCALVAQQSERAAQHVLQRIDEVVESMDEDQQRAARADEKGDPL